jgi:PhnB protein
LANDPKEAAMAKVKAIPDDYPRVIPYLSVDDASGAIDFYVKVLGAKERMRMPGPDGRIGHAEVEIGDAMIMLADSWPESPSTPKQLGGTPVTIMVYVQDVDATYQKALDAGASAITKVEDQFYGDRSGSFEDPFGHKWHISTHVEDVPPDEMAKRAAAAMGG